MSRKVSFGASSGGDYSLVLIQGKTSKSKNRFQRITDIRLEQVMASGTEGYKCEIDQAKIGNGIFCGIGMLSGTYVKKRGGSSELRLISAPIIYGQILFEEDGEAEISEWIVNYDISTALISRNTSEEEEAYSVFNPEASKSTNKIIEEVEQELSNLDPLDLKSIGTLSEKILSEYGQIAETSCEILEMPIDGAKASIEARDTTKQKQFFYSPGDWIYFAPVPTGLSTYRALDDLAKENAL